MGFFVPICIVWCVYSVTVSQKVANGRQVQPLSVGLMLQFENLKKPQEIVDKILSRLDDKISSTDKDIQVNISTEILTMNDNSISNVLSLCEQFVQPRNPIHALIVSHPPNKPLDNPEALSYACEFYKIPIVSISTQDPIYSEKALHSTFLRTVPSETQQASVWADLLHDPMFRYSRVVLVYPDNYNGEQFYQSVLMNFKRAFILVSDTVHYKTGLSKNEAEKVLRNMKTALRVFLFYGSKEDAGVMFSAALNVGMLESGYFWLVSQSAATVAPQGSVFVELKQKEDVAWHLERAMRALQSGLYNFLKRENRLEPFDKLQPLVSCNSRGWSEGQSFFRSIRDQKLEEMIQFDSSGSPTYSEYNVYIKQDNNPKTFLGSWMQGTGGKDSRVDVDEAKIKSGTISWIGGRNIMPEGVTIDGSLRVVTVKDPPFVFVNNLDGEQFCDNSTHTVCIEYSPKTGEPMKKCCYGYCIQLLRSVAVSLNFTYTLHLSKDKKFGNYKIVTRENSTKSERVWTGAIGELIRDEADVIFSSMTIDHDRSKVVDFTNPYKPQGLSIVVKRQRPSSSFSSFIQPFDYSLWILIVLSVHVVAVILWLLDRFSPFARSRQEIHHMKLDHVNCANSIDTTSGLRGGPVGVGGAGAAGFPHHAMEDEEVEEALNLSSALWFAYGVLLNSGIGGTPRSFAARVLGMVWAGFAMIIVASYTANLAAYLVLERPESEITGINDARMRNPSESYPYGTVSDSAVENYFRRKVEMTNMYHFMQNYSYPTQEEAILALKTGELQAFIWDSAQLDYETSRDCSLMMVGDTFHRSGLAVALQKDSAWTEKISLQILKMRETGEMEQLDRDWIIVHSCERGNNKPSTLGIDSMAGIFITVALGVILASVIIVGERIYYHHFDGGVWASEQQQHLARSAFDKWRLHTEEMPGFSDGGSSGVIQGKLVDSVDGAQRYQFGGSSSVLGAPPGVGGGGNMTPLNAETLSPQMNKHGSRMSLETGGNTGISGGSQIASKTSGRHGTSSPPTPPMKTSSLERNFSNRIVQFKQAPPDLHDANAAYVDV